MTNYKIQLERLKQHYQTSLNHYDAISFLDLASTLRLWTEVKTGIEKFNAEPNFKKGILTNKVKAILGRSEYVYTYLPDGVTTSAGATGEVDGRTMFQGPMTDQFSTCMLIKKEPNGDLTIAQFLIIDRSLNGEESKILHEEIKNVPIEKINFSKYMESPAIRFQFAENSGLKQITNEELIKRIANEYEGSHADKADTNFELNNVFSEPVKRLMAYGCVSLPLPYFILLHISKQIIENFDGKLQ